MKHVVALIGVATILLCMGMAASANLKANESEPSQGETIPPMEAESLSEAFTMVAQTDTLEMGIDLWTGNIAVREKEGGAVWYTNPPDWEQQDLSQDMAEQIRSQLIISFVDSALNEMTLTSYNGSVSTDNFEVRQIDNGIRITYHFAETVTQFRIPVEVTLKDDYMQAAVIYSDIEEYGTSQLTSINLFPYFGAGYQLEEGYALVPDGSGAIIRFSDNTKGARGYNQPVYGSDPSVGLLLKSTNSSQSIRMPVFGVKKGDGAFLAVIHEGEAAASIRAESDVAYSPYTAVSSAFIYHQQDLTGIRDKESNQRTVLMLQDKPVSEAPCVRYYFLNRDAADYSGMARRYQKYLEKETGLTIDAEVDKQVTLQFFGKTSKDANFLGISYQKSVTATTLSDVAEALDTLESGGITGTNVLLYGFEKGGFENQYAFTAAIDSAVGGHKGYASLLERDGNNRIYMVYELTRDYGSGFRLFNRNQYVKSLNKVNVVRQNPMLSTWDWDEKGVSWKYLTVDCLQKNSENLSESLKENGITGVLFHQMGGELYSDFQEESPTDRQQLLAVYQSIATQTAEAGIQLAADGGNAYMAGLAALQIETPTESSEQDIFSETIPFYSMVYHGYVSLASQPVNLAADPQEYLLSLLGTGIQPSYWLTSCASSELNETPLQFLYNASFDKWEEDIIAAGTRYAQLHQGLEKVRIREHSRTGDLGLVCYENGVVLATNFGSEELQWQGHSISAGEVLRIEAPVEP